MVDLKNVRVDFSPNSAYAVLLGLVLNCGIDSVMSALGEIAAQQMRRADSDDATREYRLSLSPDHWARMAGK